MKWFIVEKPTDSDFCTVVVMGTRGQHVYNTDIAIIIKTTSDLHVSSEFIYVMLMHTKSEKKIFI